MVQVQSTKEQEADYSTAIAMGYTLLGNFLNALSLVCMKYSMEN